MALEGVIHREFQFLDQEGLRQERRSVGLQEFEGARSQSVSGKQATSCPCNTGTNRFESGIRVQTVRIPRFSWEFQLAACLPEIPLWA
jgi:hypothetical protein